MNVNQGRAIVTGLRAGDLRPIKAVVARLPQLQSPRWLFGFVGVEIACQLGLLLPSIAGLRIFVRTAAFIGSIVLLLVLPRGHKAHPASKAAFVAIGIYLLSLVHPTTNTMLAGLATVGLAVSVLGPMFWAPRIRIDVATVRNLFLLYWSFSSLSALFGVLQIYFPGRFDPVASTVVSEQYLDALHIRLADGTRVLRPMGLTDGPGGAGVGAAYSIILAVAFLLDRPNPLFRLLLLASIGCSSFVLYICQIRSLLVMAIISLLALSIPFVTQGRSTRYLRVAIPLVAIALGAFSMAVSVGGDAVTGRLSTLVNDDASAVYYANRGRFLSYTFSDLLPQYPLGAGLGRWGMTNVYFGDPYNFDSKPLWAEIQWTGWLFDGGVPLMLAYATAIVMAAVTAVRSAMRVDEARGRDLYKWASVLAGYTIGTIALTFNCCPFVGTLGIDFWVLNAVVFAASQQLQTA